MNQLTCLILVGIPGSSKSTHAATFLAEHPDYTLICPDLIREQVCGDMSCQSMNGYIFVTLVPAAIRSAAQMGQSIVYDATNVSRKARKGIIKMAREQGYRIVAHVMRTPYEECVKRNAARARQVPLDVLERMHKGWQEPALDEGIDEIVDIGVQMALDTIPQV